MAKFMNALQIISRGKTEFVKAEIPNLKPGYVLVKPKLVSLCGSDIWTLHYSADEMYPFPPGSSGHEIIAEIVEIDSDFETFKIGDECLVIAPDHRGMAEYYLAEQKNLIPLNSEKTLEELLMSQQLGTVIYAAKQMPNIIGKTVAVIGQGSAGQWFNFILRRLGALKILGIDKIGGRLKLSKDYGATHTFNNSKESVIDYLKEINEGELADFVIEASGTMSAINLSFELAKNDLGFILQFGVPREPMEIDYYTMLTKCLTIRSIDHAHRENGHSSTKHAMELISSGIIDTKPILTHRFSFREVKKAYEIHRNASDDCHKIVIEIH
tara:strand:- start:3149 stop:4126 length:978 start_codon:yes stop_codon:yes gene_type:complete